MSNSKYNVDCQDPETPIKMGILKDKVGADKSTLSRKCQQVLAHQGNLVNTVMRSAQ